MIYKKGKELLSSDNGKEISEIFQDLSEQLKLQHLPFSTSAQGLNKLTYLNNASYSGVFHSRHYPYYLLKDS